MFLCFKIHQVFLTHPVFLHTSVMVCWSPHSVHSPVWYVVLHDIPCISCAVMMVKVSTIAWHTCHWYTSEMQQLILWSSPLRDVCGTVRSELHWGVLMVQEMSVNFDLRPGKCSFKILRQWSWSGWALKYAASTGHSVFRWLSCALSPRLVLVRDSQLC